ADARRGGRRLRFAVRRARADGAFGQRRGGNAGRRVARRIRRRASGPFSHAEAAEGPALAVSRGRDARRPHGRRYLASDPRGTAAPTRRKADSRRNGWLPRDCVRFELDPLGDPYGPPRHVSDRDALCVRVGIVRSERGDTPADCHAHGASLDASHRQTSRPASDLFEKAAATPRTLMTTSMRAFLHPGRSFGKSLVVLVGSFLVFCASGARADTASEAKLQFELGAEYYKQGKYPEALERFIASNRSLASEAVSAR